jgi:indole-3-glycerol phosphate synthase
VTNPEESERALAAGARLIGVNARDLDTLAMDPTRVRQVLEALPDHVVSAHFSGLGSAEAVAGVAAGRAHAALVGEALMRKDDPEELLRELVAAAGGRENSRSP